MSEVVSIYGFTGTIWEVPNIDKLSTGSLLKNYRELFFTQKNNDTLWLGIRESIPTNLPNMLARAVLESVNLTVPLVSPVRLTTSEWRLITSGKESNGSVTFPDKEKIIINGGQYIATNSDGDSRYIGSLTDNISKYRDPVIGSSQVFYDCQLHDITVSNLTQHYHKSLLLIGGLLFETRALYDDLGSSVNLKGRMEGWLPTLYKKVAEVIDPNQCGLTWPIKLADLKQGDLYNRLISLPTSRLVVFNTPGPVTYNSRSIPRLFSRPVTGIVGYDDRPSPERVTEIFHLGRTPTKNALYPEYCDLEGSDGELVTIEHTVQDIAPREHIISFIEYEVKV